MHIPNNSFISLNLLMSAYEISVRLPASSILFSSYRIPLGLPFLPKTGPMKKFFNSFIFD